MQLPCDSRPVRASSFHWLTSDILLLMALTSFMSSAAAMALAMRIDASENMSFMGRSLSFWMLVSLPRTVIMEAAFAWLFSTILGYSVAIQFLRAASMAPGACCGGAAAGAGCAEGYDGA
jgi:hypothetical protein